MTSRTILVVLKSELRAGCIVPLSPALSDSACDQKSDFPANSSELSPAMGIGWFAKMRIFQDTADMGRIFATRKPYAGRNGFRVTQGCGPRLFLPIPASDQSLPNAYD
jgi:hypothetical protein